MTDRAIIYARSASAEQGQPSSIFYQIAECSKYATEQRLDVVRIVAEAGVSGMSGARPVFRQMIAELHAQPNPRDIILVHDFDRISRSISDLKVICQQLEADGIVIRSVVANDGDADAKWGTMYRMLALHDEYQGGE